MNEDKKEEKREYRVTGMSCGHCENAVEKGVSAIAGVTKAKASASGARLTVMAAAEVSDEAVIRAITDAGYNGERIDNTPPGGRTLSWRSFVLIIIGALIVLGVVSTTVGFSSFPTLKEKASFGVIFIVGLLTSLHCIAMCGGINLSQCLVQSGSCPRRFSGVLPATLYNGGRLISYTLTGGIVGALGGAFNFSPALKGAIMLTAGLLMLLMGLSFAGLFTILPKAGLFSLPGKLASFKPSPYSAFAVGLASALIPCGPLQAMQLYALGSGGAVEGASAMFVFALGTIPLPFALGAFSSFISKRFTSTMFKAGGFVIILLACIMMANGFALFGRSGGSDTLRSSSPAGTQQPAAVIQDGVQRVRSTMNSREYEPITVTAGIPLEWTLVARPQDLNGCNEAIVIPEYSIEKRLVAGDNLIKFTPKKSGTITFSCWMGMIRSTIQVVDVPSGK